MRFLDHFGATIKNDYSILLGTLFRRYLRRVLLGSVRQYSQTVYATAIRTIPMIASAFMLRPSSYNPRSGCKALDARQICISGDFSGLPIALDW